MAVSVADAPRKVAAAASLVEVERVKVHSGVLAVARRADGTLILAREVERDVLKRDASGAVVKDDDGKPVKTGERERVLKGTSDLADFADALTAGLIATA